MLAMSICSTFHVELCQMSISDHGMSLPGLGSSARHRMTPDIAPPCSKQHTIAILTKTYIWLDRSLLGALARPALSIRFDGWSFEASEHGSDLGKCFEYGVCSESPNHKPLVLQPPEKSARRKSNLTARSGPESPSFGLTDSLVQATRAQIEMYKS